MRRPLLLGVVPLLAAAATLGSARTAHAGPFLGIDPDLGSAFQDRVRFAYGLGGRFGWKLHFDPAPVWILPEVGGHFTAFDAPSVLGHAGAAFGGMRFGFGRVVQPNVFGHVGAGFVGRSDVGPYADLGIGLDFQITRVFSLGVQGAYNVVADLRPEVDSTRWASFGLNLGFDFLRSERRYHRYAR